jgi:hypothetical protein
MLHRDLVTMAQNTQTNTKNKKSGLEGEGSYSATRKYNEGLAKHQKQANVDALAKSARKAVEGPEGAELRRAEEQGKRGPRR